MLELYFLLVRVPRIMSRLAKERNRSAVGWSLLAIAAWIGSEMIVIFVYTFIHMFGEEHWGWRDNPPVFLTLFAYVLALGAAVGGAYFVQRVLRSLPTYQPPPPLPPQF
jgi:hypothetical protein